MHPKSSQNGLIFSLRTRNSKQARICCNQSLIVILYFCELAGRSRGRNTVRKVRASQGKGAGEMPVKVTSRKVQQKKTAQLVGQGWKGEVRAHPQIGDEAWCKPHPMQDTEHMGCPPAPKSRLSATATYRLDR